MSDQVAAREAADSDASGAVAAAGHFRTYLGAAAGVGKTYAMLSEGHRRRSRGTDVVIGFVECHGRQRTVEKLRELTADVGARWHEVQGDDPARAIAAFAQEHQITQIVIGSSQRSRWQQLTGGGSNVTRVIREAGALGIDVHVIALRKTPTAGPSEETAAARPIVNSTANTTNPTMSGT